MHSGGTHQRGVGAYHFMPCLAGGEDCDRNFRDLLAESNAHGVDYIIVGAHALAAHGHVLPLRISMCGFARVLRMLVG